MEFKKMSLVVILPTFQRPDSLVYSIKSVLNQKLNLPGVQKILHILNNDKNSQVEVDNAVEMAVKDVKDHQFDKIIVEHLTADSKIQLSLFRMMDAIKNHTVDGDVAIIHGDDDIMLRGSLLDRYSRIIKDENCVSISKYFNGLNFIRGYDGVDLSPISIDEPKPLHNEKFGKADLLNYGLPFISAYTYKINEKFWMVYKQALAWASETPIKHDAKFLFIPFYIGLSAWKSNQLSSANVYEVIRGRVFLSRKYLPPVVITQPDSPAIVNLTGLAVLKNSDLLDRPDLDDLRMVFSRNISGIVWSIVLTINKISLRDINNLLKIAGVSVLLNSFSFVNILKNVKILVEIVFNFSNTGLWIRGFTNPISSTAFWSQWVKDFRIVKLNQPQQ